METNRNPEKKTDRQTKTNQRIRDLERGVKTHREKETKTGRLVGQPRARNVSRQSLNKNETRNEVHGLENVDR